jgi:hypothetical protein
MGVAQSGIENAKQRRSKTGVRTPPTREKTNYQSIGQNSQRLDLCDLPLVFR